MKTLCLASIVWALATGCATSAPNAAQKLAMAEYSDGYAPTGTLIKRKNVNNESNLTVLDKQALENAKNGSASGLEAPKQ